MKKILICLCPLLAALSLPAVTQAQFLKTLMDNTKNTIANKQAANAKKDSTRQGLDTTALKERMAQLAQTRSGPTISPADSAAAIQSFKTATGGSGLLYQYLDTYSFKKGAKDSLVKDTMSLYITDGHNTRSDMGLFGGRTVLLGHAGTPRYSMWLDMDAKTYRLHIIDTAALNRTDGNTYQVTKVGNETVAGYNCIHSKLSIISQKKTIVTEDIWTSTDVPGYAAIQKMTVSQNITPQIMKALYDAGCNGFFVKMTMQSTAFSMTMLLFKAARKTFPASDFEIPAGFTAQTNTNPFARMFQK